MILNFEVKRNRGSVTQGTATVYLNGQKVVTFGDNIKLIKENQLFYGEIIGGWASTTPDETFISGVMFPKFDNLYHISDKVKKILFNKNEWRI